ncbi:hypothetical protein ENTCAN_05578 [Enterobacter cancerogenus ATCC 35316]|nr:hypothetical protein ENTCAN_05578 [Enterobacter cancerogenus ATCC 35316]
MFKARGTGLCFFVQFVAPGGAALTRPTGPVRFSRGLGRFPSPLGRGLG